MKNNYYGNNAVWGIGIVEDINDPLRSSRVRVRIYGLHSLDAQELRVVDLPWSQVVLPVTEGGISGQGVSIHGLKKGSMVYGIFLDGDNKQNFLIVGSILGASKNSNNKSIKKQIKKKDNTLRKLSNNESTFYYLINRGFSSEQSAGIIGSIIAKQHEDNINIINKWSKKEFPNLYVGTKKEQLFKQVDQLIKDLSNTNWPNYIIKNDNNDSSIQIRPALSVEEYAISFTQNFYGNKK